MLGPAPAEDRLEGSLASAVWALSQGVAMVRVHDVAPTVAARSIVEG
jgi:dihydropteroate synthase